MPEKYLQNFSIKSKDMLILIPVLFGAWLALTSLNGLVSGLGVYDGKRILELYLILLTLALALLKTPVRQQFNAILKSIPSWIRIFILIFFGLGLFSALTTPHPAYPLVDVAMLFLVTITAIVMACIRLVTGKLFDRIVLVFIALMGFGVFFQELIGLLVYMSLDKQFNYRESLINFLHPRLYNQIQTWTIPLLALFPLVFIKYRWVWILSLCLIGTQWYILLSTGARGSTLSILLAMLAVGIIFPVARKFWVRMHLSGLVLGLLFYVLIAGLLNISQPDKHDFVNESVGRPMLHTSGRTDLWKHAIDDAIENPLLGSGPMRYACGANHYLAGSPHSFPLQIMGEWGFPAFLILGMIFIWLLSAWQKAVYLLKEKPEYQQAKVSCLSICCLAAVFHVSVSGLLIAPSSQVAGMLVVGWLLASLFKETGKSATNKVSGQLDASLVLLIGLLVSLSVLLFSTAELEELPNRTSYAQDYGPITPRYWQDGRFCEYSF